MHEGFELTELRPLPGLAAEYLQPPLSRDGSSLGASCKQLSVYMAGTAGRGVAAFIADWQRSALVLLVRPRGAGLSDAARAAARVAHRLGEGSWSEQGALGRAHSLSPQAHPLAEQLSLAVEAADAWGAARKCLGSV